MKEDCNLSKIIDFIGISFIGLISFLYCTFEINFAELSVQLSFLNFPIFIGEIALSICLTVLIARWIVCHQKFSAWHYLLFLYIGFVLLKALCGYFIWGPLTLRHSALFYYPLFAVFGYTFFRQEYFKNKQNIIIISVLLFIPMFLTINIRYKFISFILILLLIKSYPKRFIKYLFLLLLAILAPYKEFLGGMRAMWLSNIISIVFIFVTVAIILKLKKSLKIALGVLFLLFFSLNLPKILNKTTLETIINVKENLEQIKKTNDTISFLERHFIMYDINYVRLFNRGHYVDEASVQNDKRVGQVRDKISTQWNSIVELLSKRRTNDLALHMQSQINNLKSTQDSQPLSSVIMQAEKFEQKNNLQQGQSESPLDHYYGTNIFRIFIWKDALESLIKVKPLFGFDFGKPFRSKSIEILNSGFGEWTRDGWVAMHNSYIEIIYRSGMIGIIFIITIFIFLLKMIRISISSKSVNRLLLCGVLINWLIAANFMLILELPYPAIPFWSLFGMTLSYLKNSVNFAKK